MSDYLPILILFALAFAFVFGSILASSRLGPKQRRTSAKIAPYGCGIVPDSDTTERFPVKFYLVAMIFIIFDIEVMFLFPWAVLFGQLGTFGLVEMVLFSVSVVVAFVFLISNGALDWAPTKSLRRMESMVAQSRSTSSTIRRIAKDGTVRSSEEAA